MLRSLIIACLIHVSGCASHHTVTRTELEQLKGRWNEPKVSAWYYTGSEDGYHYFHHDDLGNDPRDVRISELELLWRDAFPLTRDRRRWRALDWGVHERRTEGKHALER